MFLQQHGCECAGPVPVHPFFFFFLKIFFFLIFGGNIVAYKSRTDVTTLKIDKIILLLCFVTSNLSFGGQSAVKHIIGGIHYALNSYQNS